MVKISEYNFSLVGGVMKDSTHFLQCDFKVEHYVCISHHHLMSIYSSGGTSLVISMFNFPIKHKLHKLY